MTPEQFLENFGAIAEAQGGLKTLRSKILELAWAGFGETGAAQVAFGSVCSFRQDLIRPSDAIDAEVVFVGSEHINKHKGTRNGGERLHASALKGRKFRFSPGEIVYTYLRPYLNKVWIATLEGVCSVDQYVLQVDANRADVRFIQIVMLGPHFLAETERLTHSLQLPRLRSRLLAGIKIPLPPLAEQKRIVAKVDQLMAMLDDLEQRQEKKRTVAIHVSKASLDSLVNAEDPDQLARAWERVSKNFGVVGGAHGAPKMLRSVILGLAYSGGGSGSAHREPLGEFLTFRQDLIRPSDRVDEDVIFVGPEHIEKDTGRLNGYERTHAAVLTGRKFRFSSGEIVYTYLRPYLNKVWVATLEGVCSVDQYVLRVDEEKAMTRFVQLVMLGPQFLAETARLTHSLQLPRLRSKLLVGIEVPLPSLKEQERIVAKVDSLLATLCDIELLAATRAAVATRLTKSAMDVPAGRGRRAAGGGGDGRGAGDRRARG